MNAQAHVYGGVNRVRKELGEAARSVSFPPISAKLWRCL